MFAGFAFSIRFENVMQFIDNTLLLSQNNIFTFSLRKCQNCIASMIWYTLLASYELNKWRRWAKNNRSALFRRQKVQKSLHFFIHVKLHFFICSSFRVHCQFSHFSTKNRLKTTNKCNKFTAELAWIILRFAWSLLSIIKSKLPVFTQLLSQSTQKCRRKIRQGVEVEQNNLFRG